MSMMIERTRILRLYVTLEHKNRQSKLSPIAGFVQFKNSN